MAATTPPAGNLPPASTPTSASAGNTSPVVPSQGGVKPPATVVSVPIPANKPDEPAFQLQIEPDSKLEFKSDKLTEEPCQIEVKLTNPTKDRQTFKVKCTSNEIFRVRPPLGFCDAQASTLIKITFSSKTVPPSGRHYFAFYHMKSDEKEKTARQVWTPESKFEGVRRVTVYFLKNDGTVAPSIEIAPQEGNAHPTGAPAGGAAQAASATGNTPAQPATSGGSTPAADADAKGPLVASK